MWLNVYSVSLKFKSCSNPVPILPNKSPMFEYSVTSYSTLLFNTETLFNLIYPSKKDTSSNNTLQFTLKVALKNSDCVSTSKKFSKNALFFLEPGNKNPIE